jgi:hypothetical protein
MPGRIGEIQRRQVHRPMLDIGDAGGVRDAHRRREHHGRSIDRDDSAAGMHALRER